MLIQSLCKRVILCCICFAVFTAGVSADIEKRQGNFVLRLIDSSGTFSLQYKNDDGKTIQFFSPNENFSSTFFAVKIDNTVYKLSRDSAVHCIAEETEQGAKLIYTIKGKAEITVDFAFCPEFDGAAQCVVKVAVTVVNSSSKTESVSLKGIFDTVLGENTGIHFATARRSGVSTELALESFSGDKWIRSSNDKAAVQFLLNGAGITVPKSAALANKDVLADSSWMPVIRPGRSFNSVFSYNNSAAGIFWNPVSLTPMTRSSTLFYISMSAAGATPPDAQFLGTSGYTVSHLNADDEIVYQDEHGTVYTVGAVTDEQLDPKYIEDLLLRIRRLESNPESAEHIEIIRLNAELDAILEKIRRQQ